MTDNEKNKNVEIGENLKKFFKEKGITQVQIANKLEISQAAVAALLNGKPFGKKTAQTWADCFNIQPSWLLTGEGEMLRKTEENEAMKSIRIDGNEFFLTLLEKKDSEIKKMSEEIGRLKEQNESLREQIKKTDESDNLENLDKQINRI
jgi:transcriptional regulator with XRE-family HTH domain